MSIDDPLKALEEILKPDPRRPHLVGTLAEEHADLATISLNDAVPVIVAQLFETAKNVSLYSWFVYRFHPVSESVAFSEVHKESSANLTRCSRLDILKISKGMGIYHDREVPKFADRLSVSAS